GDEEKTTTKKSSPREVLIRSIVLRFFSRKHLRVVALPLEGSTLVCDYLEKKVRGGSDGAGSSHGGYPVIVDVDLNKCEPWDLPGEMIMLSSSLAA
ncbi:hypothetical protein B296_00004218, partial [Ensete ventricosum]